MNAEPKLELSWSQPADGGEPEPCVTFEAFDPAKGAAVIYQAAFGVCPAPRCGCFSVSADCTPRLPGGSAAAGAVRRFWLDARQRSLGMTPELQEDAETLRLARLVSTRLAETAWEELHRWFWTAKIRVIETAEVSEIDITDLPDAEGGLMVPFIEVFPLGLSLNFTFQQAAWAADEAYCVQPDCRCTESLLSFLMLKDATGKVTPSLHDVPSIRYNYRSHASSLVAAGLPGTPPTGQLLAALQTAYPLLDPRLELHHKIMQTLYARHYMARINRHIGRLAAELAPRGGRVGRNDPCPCGSGKKFKKCCGA